MLRGLLAEGVPELRILSRDEEKQDALRNELRDDRVKYYIGDIRDIDSVRRAMSGVVHRQSRFPSQRDGHLQGDDGKICTSRRP